MKKRNKNIESQYLPTFLSEGKGKMEILLAGVKHEIRNANHNINDDFVFLNCKKVNFIHPLGTVYLHKGFGYVCAGYFWYRFQFHEMLVLSN